MKHLKLMAGIFGTCLLVYIITLSGHHYSIDGIVMFQYAKSLIFDRSLIMDPPIRWGVDFFVGKWPIGLSIAYIPVLAILSVTVFAGDDTIKRIPFDPQLTHNPELLANRPYRYSSFLNPTITAASAVLLYFFCRQIGLSNKKAAMAALIFGLASPAAVYAKFDFAQPLASFFILFTFIFLFREQGNEYLNIFLGGLSMGFAILTRPELILLSPIMIPAIYFIGDHLQPKNKHRILGQIKRIMSFIFPLLIFFIINQLVNYSKFGSWLNVGYQLDSEFTFSLRNIATALIGNIVSPGRGVILYFPISLLSLWGIKELFQLNRILAWVLAFFTIGSFTFYSAWKDWGAGISWGPRFFIPLMPYLTIVGLLGINKLLKSAKKWGFLLASLLTIVGWMIAIQGLLFNFLDFYATLDLPQPVIDQGNYNYLPQNSPIFAGWGELNKPLEYDIYWLKNIKTSQGRSLLIPVIGVLTLGYAFKSWVQFFTSPENP